MNRQVTNKPLWQVISLILVILVAGNYVSAQESSAEEEPYKINGKEVKEYLIEKYKLSRHDVTSTLQETPNGPKGNLHINSFEKPISPKKIIPVGDVQTRARAVARAFLEEESALLGITNIDEIREREIKTSKGHDGDYTNIYYHRYINNLILNGLDIRITIGPNETITSISANLVPASPELYEAVKKKTLTEDEIRKIVEDDLKAAAKSPETTPFEKSIVRNWLPHIKTMEMKKLAISSPPYVVWKVESVWKYTIDAFTGEILKKYEGWIE